MFAQSRPTVTWRSQIAGKKSYGSVVAKTVSFGSDFIHHSPGTLMSRDEFYLVRILWKAKKNRLLENGCLLYDETDIAMKTAITDRVSLLGTPVLLFWSNENLWTLLTTEELVSHVDAALNRVFLDDIRKEVKIEPVVSEARQATKLESEILFVGESSIRIWSPKGKLIFGLWNTLLMFPLTEPSGK
jgi:hypothetical protein